MKISFEHRTGLDELYTANQYVQTKNVKDIPEKVMKDIHLVTIPGNDDPIPFGSYVNRISDYFGDIDVIQMFTGCCDVEDVGKKTAKAFKDMVKGIKKARLRYFSEFKAGIDKPYYFDIGKCVEGVYRPSKDLKERTRKLHELGLLTDLEMKIVMNVCKKPRKTGDDYDTVFNLYREKYVLRWTENEVLQGWKEISTGKIKLEEAVLDTAPVKIDMIAVNDGGKFIEVTNFFALGLNIDGYFFPINIHPSSLTPENLPPEIEKFYASNYYYNPFKSVKRSFSYIKYLYKKHNDPEVAELVEKYAEILKSTINILYTINSEMDAIRLVLCRVKNPPRKAIKSRLSLLKEPLANVLEIDKDNLALLMEMMDVVIEKPTADSVKTLMKIFKEIINFWTIAYFDQLGLNPPPREVVPEIKTYDPNIIREPWDVPINPLDLAIAEAGGVKGGFIKSLGKSIFQKVANKYRANFCDGKARPLHKGEYHLPCHNFTGPGTRVDLEAVRNYPPYNEIDACARQHDLDYMKAVELPDDERKKAITEADKEILKCIENYKDVSGYTAAKMGINSKMKLAEVLPIISKSMFGKISAAGCCGGPKNVGGARRVRLIPPGTTRKHRLRPGEDPAIAKQALKDAAKLVGSVFSGNPAGIVGAVKDIGQHLTGILTQGGTTVYSQAGERLYDEDGKRIDPVRSTSEPGKRDEIVWEL